MFLKQNEGWAEISKERERERERERVEAWEKLGDRKSV